MRLSDQIATHVLTGAGGVPGAWLMLRSKKVEQASTARVAEITAEPAFAQQLGEALDKLDTERQLVAQLRIDLAAVTSERDVLAEHVTALSQRLDDTTRRLGELGEHFSALAHAVQRQIPAQPTDAPVKEPR